MPIPVPRCLERHSLNKAQPPDSHYIARVWPISSDALLSPSCHGRWVPATHLEPAPSPPLSERLTIPAMTLAADVLLGEEHVTDTPNRHTACHQAHNIILPDGTSPVGNSTKVGRVMLPDISYVLHGRTGHGQYREVPALVSPSGPATLRVLKEEEIRIANALFSTEPSQYSAVCEPLAHWLAQYLWKVVTMGMSLPSSFVGTGCGVVEYPESLSLLVESLSALLLSTSLQPSAIILALQYIARLPAYLGPCPAVLPAGGSASLFRAALVRPDATMHDSAVTQTLYSAFKLFVLGAILSNKVLDDHVFTLKTWHEISGIPLDVLNRLEWLSLDVLSHELYLDPRTWSRWVHILREYQLFTEKASPQHEDTLQRRSCRIVQVMLETLATLDPAEAIDRPIFLGLEARVNEKRLDNESGAANGYAFQMDEDGPLREEYIPKRRAADFPEFSPSYSPGYNHVEMAESEAPRWLTVPSATAQQTYNWRTSHITDGNRNPCEIYDCLDIRGIRPNYPGRDYRKSDTVDRDGLLPSQVQYSEYFHGQFLVQSAWIAV